MNEQRQQAYVNLIQSLLNCRSNYEVREILAVNQELVDVGFLQTLEAVAEMFSQQGDENTANWLQGLASYLKEALNPNSKVDLQSLSEEEKAYLLFLMEVLKATTDSKCDSQVVYPLLEKNINKLDKVLAEILRSLVADGLRKREADVAQFIAREIVDFSTLIAQFPLGNKASNMEIAITGYEVALIVYTQQAFPSEWATVQNNLGGVYSDRILGKRAENLEQAIAACQEALKVYTFETFPYEWATTQIHLGTAYCQRIREERTENLELAIAAYQQALKIYTFEALPSNWAETQNNLANAYSNRILGEQVENLELAIACYQEALKVHTFDAFPNAWAVIQNNLANAYRDRILGKPAENLELAISCYQEALKVHTFDAIPVINSLNSSWQMILLNFCANLSK